MAAAVAGAADRGRPAVRRPRRPSCRADRPGSAAARDAVAARSPTTTADAADGRRPRRRRRRPRPGCTSCRGRARGASPPSRPPAAGRRGADLSAREPRRPAGRRSSRSTCRSSVRRPRPPRRCRGPLADRRATGPVDLNRATADRARRAARHRPVDGRGDRRPPRRARPVRVGRRPAGRPRHRAGQARRDPRPGDGVSAASRAMVPCSRAQPTSAWPTEYLAIDEGDRCAEPDAAGQPRVGAPEVVPVGHRVARSCGGRRRRRRSTTAATLRATPIGYSDESENGAPTDQQRRRGEHPEHQADAAARPCRRTASARAARSRRAPPAARRRGTARGCGCAGGTSAVLRRRVGDMGMRRDPARLRSAGRRARARS